MDTKKCLYKMEVGYNERTNRLIYVPCGMTGPDGTTALCDSCLAKMKKRFPQGWSKTPGDRCKHGVYVGSAGGPDFMCGYCENGE